MVDMYIAKSIDSGYLASDLGLPHRGYVGLRLLTVERRVRAEVAMAGTDPGFDAAGFRRRHPHGDGRSAHHPMKGERATFHFASPPSSTTAVMDGDRVPFDPTATVTTTEPPTVQVDCAIEYFDSERAAHQLRVARPVAGSR
jgi:hypothetical protein